MFLFIAITSRQGCKKSTGYIKSEKWRLIPTQKQAVKLVGNRRSKVQEIKASWELRAENYSSGLRKDIKPNWLGQKGLDEVGQSDRKRGKVYAYQYRLEQIQ